MPFFFPLIRQKHEINLKEERKLKMAKQHKLNKLNPHHSAIACKSRQFDTSACSRRKIVWSQAPIWQAGGKLEPVGPRTIFLHRYNKNRPIFTKKENFSTKTHKNLLNTTKIKHIFPLFTFLLMSCALMTYALLLPFTLLTGAFLLPYALVPYDLFCRKIRQSSPDFRQKVIVLLRKFEIF
jgi:hypothetical protein